MPTLTKKTKSQMKSATFMEHSAKALEDKEDLKANDNGQTVVPGVSTDADIRKAKFAEYEREVTIKLGEISKTLDSLVNLQSDIDIQNSLQRLKIILSTINSLEYLMRKSGNIGIIKIQKVLGKRSGRINVVALRDSVTHKDDEDEIIESAKIKKEFLSETFIA